MKEMTQSDLDMMVEALDTLNTHLRHRAKSRMFTGDGNATYRKYLCDRAERAAALAETFRRQAAANRLASRAMDIIDKAVSDGILPG